MGIIERFAKLSTSNVADALDKHRTAGWIEGVIPITVDPVRVVGRAVTVRLTDAGPYSQPSSLEWGDIVDSAKKGDVVVIQVGRFVSTWGDLLSTAANLKGISATVTDGAVRDVAAIRKVGYPVFAKGRIPLTAKLRVKVQEIGDKVVCGGIPIEPGDVVFGDDSGVVVVPKEMESEVLKSASELADAEDKIRRDVLKGATLKQAHTRHGYSGLTKPPPTG